MDNNIDHPLTLTVEQAAKLLGIGRSTAYELVHTGDIPSLRLGRRIVVPVADVAGPLGVDLAAIWGALSEEPASARSRGPVGARSGAVAPRLSNSAEETATLF